MYKEDGDKLKHINLNAKPSSYSHSSSIHPQKLIAKDKFNRIPCSCTSKTTQPINSQIRNAGWEGPAILHHGSHIKIGCFQFIFSITQFGSPSPSTSTSSSSCNPSFPNTFHS